MAPRLRQLGVLAAATQDVTLNTDQSGFGFAPIVGAHFRSKYIDLAAKYEFRTRIAFENESANSASANNLTSLAAYKDDAQVRSDIPALLTVGAQVRPVEGLRLNLGYHHYFDKYLFGAEYDLTKQWEISAGVQRTLYPNTDAYMNDLTFTANSTSLGLGVGYQVNDMVKINAGYFKTFYDTYHKDSQNYNNAANIIGVAEGAERAKQLVESGVVKGSDDFTRTNQVFGLGVELTF